MADKILVFITVYNCERQIPRVLASFENPEIAKHFFEVLVLDNGSRDGTLAVAEQAARRITHVPVTLARNRGNYGLGGSHKSAFAYAVSAGFTHAVILHGDDQGNIEDLLPVLSRGEHRLHDCCLGARFMEGSRITGYSRFRIFGNHVFNLLYSLATLRVIPDMGSGLNLYSTAFLMSGFYKRYTDGLHFSCCLLLGSLARKAKITFFPISWREEDQVSNVRLLRQAWQTFSLAAGYVFCRKRYFAAEHRETPREEYGFDVIWHMSPTP